MKEGFSRFDAADYLKTEEDIAGFLDAATEDGDANDIALALGTVARARNMSQLARDLGMSREGLNKALGPAGNPTLATVVKIAAALGFEIAFRRKAQA